MATADDSIPAEGEPVSYQIGLHRRLDLNPAAAAMAPPVPARKYIWADLAYRGSPIFFIPASIARLPPPIGRVLHIDRNDIAVDSISTGW
jgi:hypothetical protein